MKLHALDIDSLDRRILEYLQIRGRASNLELAENVGLSPAQCHRRHRRLEDDGLIENYAARVQASRIGLGVVAFVNLSLDTSAAQGSPVHFKTVVSGLAPVLECYALAGESDYVLKVIVRDVAALSSFVMGVLMQIPGVSGIRSSICLEEVKFTTALPLA